MPMIRLPRNVSPIGVATGPIDTSDIWNVPTCDGVNVNTIVASEEEDWSLCSLSGTDGKDVLRRRGDEMAGKKVHFIGWDRVWLETGGSLCQAKLFDKKVAAGRVRLVLLKSIGKSVVTGDYEDAALRETLRVRCG